MEYRAILVAMMHDDSDTDTVPVCIQACVCVHGQRNECWYDGDDVNNHAHYVYVADND
jgi:hypothetical protein